MPEQKDVVTGKADSSCSGEQTGDDLYALLREEATARRGAGWWVSLRRRGHKIVRLFKDSVHGSPGASFCQAKAYRDAVLAALPPLTNHEQAVQLRRTNQSGISGVRRIETAAGDLWQATLMTRDGQKRENFSVSKFGEAAAKSMAIAQRERWLKALPVTHLAYAHHAEAVADLKFKDLLSPVTSVRPERQMSEEEIERRLNEINAQFDALRPPRLRVRVKSYHEGRLSVSVSDAGQPAKRSLVQVNVRGLAPGEMRSRLGQTLQKAIARIYSDPVAEWFMESQAPALVDAVCIQPEQGFNVLLFVPPDIGSQAGEDGV